MKILPFAVTLIRRLSLMNVTTCLKTLIAAIAVPLFLSAAAQADDVIGRWPAAKAWQWYEAQPWLVGFNYIPATAINTTEMWQADTFDPENHRRGIGLGRAGRVQLRPCVRAIPGLGGRSRGTRSSAWSNSWRSRRSTASARCSCCSTTATSPAMTEPFLGKQPDVIPGEYANGWTPSPGPKRVQDRTGWPKLRAIRPRRGRAPFARPARARLGNLQRAHPVPATG